MFPERVKLFFSRFKSAIIFGFFFLGAKNFTVPKKITINNKLLNLYLPNEYGIKISFIEIFLDDVYKLKWIQNYSKKKGFEIKSIIDIGGNCGLTSLLFRQYFPYSEINCYEPNKKLNKYLKNNSAQGKFDFFSEAVGNSSGKVKLNTDKKESILTFVSNDPKGSTPIISFEEALKRFKNETVDIVKMDCEGSEWEIFKDKNSWKKVKFLTMEYHLEKNKYDHQKIIYHLNEIGFKAITKINYSDKVNYGMVLAYNTLKISI